MVFLRGISITNPLRSASPTPGSELAVHFMLGRLRGTQTSVSSRSRSAPRRDEIKLWVWSITSTGITLGRLDWRNCWVALTSGCFLEEDCRSWKC